MVRMEIGFEKVVRMEVGWYDEPDNSSGSIGEWLSEDAATVRALVGDAVAQMVSNLASIVVGLVIAFCCKLAVGIDYPSTDPS
ncbi:hypothetical protein REPUB_Repub07fG0033000 [Reevesia pubescens]